MQRFRYLIYFGVIVIGLTAAIWQTISRMNKNTRLKRHGLICDGIPASIQSTGRIFNSLKIHYRFPFHGNQYEQVLTARDMLMSFEDEIFYYKGHVPVLVDTTDPENSHLLLRPSDFIYFGLPFPDSLNWVFKYMNNPPSATPSGK